MPRIIVEGLNAVGKSTLCKNLKFFLEENKNSVIVRHGLDESFSCLRKNTYSRWNSLSSMLYYIASNIEVMNEKKNVDYLIYDRSFLSTLTMFMSRDNNWDMGVDFLKLLIKNGYIDKEDIIIILEASDSTRKKRILSKSDPAALNADLKELGFENKKEEAYRFLTIKLEHDHSILTLNNDSLSEQQNLITVLSFLKTKSILDESSFIGL